MTDFKVSEEKAAEWNVTPQYIQSLCRAGKVQGAFKRAGIWFIPDDAPNPTKKTKADAAPFEFSGTKKGIFENAIKLFVLRGYDDVSVQDIADATGISQSAVYNHFKSKQELLDTIYDFYRHNYLTSQPSLKDVEPILREGSLYDILTCTRYEFDKDVQEKMSDITKIVFQRKVIDERARKLAKQFTMDEGIRFVEAIFNRAVEIGRLAPLDAHAISVFINGAALFSLHSWLIDSSPESMKASRDDENTLFKYAARLLTDLKPPEKAREPLNKTEDF